MALKVYRDTESDLRALAQVLRRGGVAAVPSETVYGLAGNALNISACKRIFSIKNRPRNDPLIVHIGSVEEARQLGSFTATAQILAEAFWPGPLTLVMEKDPVLPDLVTADLSTVALRVPSHPALARLLSLCRLPLAIPSANPFGYVSPTRPAHVRRTLGHRIRHLLDAGPCPIGVETTVVDVRDDASPQLLRLGAVTREALETALGQAVAVLPRARRELRPLEIDKSSKAAPGMFPRHYSPHTPIFLLSSEQGDGLRQAIASGTPPDLPLLQAPEWAVAATGTIALLLQRAPTSPGDQSSPQILSDKELSISWLSSQGDLRTVARELYRALHDLDGAGHAAIVAELASEAGLGAAINDRLRHAAAR